MEPSELLKDTSELGACAVFTPSGEKLLLSSLWAKHKIIFVFLRHFACIACRAHAVQIWSDREKFEKSGSKLIFIGTGQPDFINKFKEDLGLTTALVLTDPSLESFKAAGFRNGFFYVANPSSLVNAVKLTVQGHTQSSYSADAGSHWQLGGVLAVAPGGKILFQFISEAVGDFPEEKQINAIVAEEEMERKLNADNP